MVEPGHKQAIVLAQRWRCVPGLLAAHSLLIVSRCPVRSQASILVVHYDEEAGNYLQSNVTEVLYEGDAVFDQVKVALPGAGQMGWLNAYPELIIHGVAALPDCVYPGKR